MIRTTLATWACLVGLAAATAQAPDADEETDRHLASLRERLDDRTIDLSVREDLALEMAGTLDRAARAAPSLEAKQARWDSAVELLDEFDRRNPDHPRRLEFGLQAAVYRWAQARTWHDRRALFPAQAPLAGKEAAALDDAVARLRPLVGRASGGLADNIRFRLAWALADRASLEDDGAPTAAMRREEALDLLKEPPSERSLAGFHALLKAELLREAGKFEEAAVQADLAQKADPPPPETEVMDLVVRILIGRAMFDEARKKVDASGLPAPRKDLLHVRIDLAAWEAEPEGPMRRERRRAIEEDLVRRDRSLREANAPEARVALIELARSGARFDDDASHAILDDQAGGFEILGNLDKAAATAEQAADRASRSGLPEEAGASRLRAGGYLFQAGRYAEAASDLGRVVDDPQAGPSRAKAGLLQALALGRAQAAGSDGVAPDAYSQALRRQLREFPDDSTADEARWMLGTLEASRGERDEAMALWKAVPVESPRWVRARVSACEALRRELQDRVAAEERDGLEDRFAEASAFLDESLALARDRPDADRADLLLARARLNLVPIVGKPATARDAADQCSAMNVSAARRYEARLSRLIALASLGRYLEAEREAQQHASWAVASERPILLGALRQIDLAASAADTDLLQRRLGLIARLLIQPLLQDESTSDDDRNELTFRMARAQLFQGDPKSAQATLQGWAPSTRKADDRFLRDLADTYFRLDANELAIDVERLRIKNLTAGAPAWFDARYGLALAYYRLGRKQDALQLIEGTAILHPDLGGGRLRDRFIRLRQRLGSAP